MGMVACGLMVSPIPGLWGWESISASSPSLQETEAM